MKRSRNIKLALMATSALALTACEEPEPQVSADLYRTVEQCVSGGKFTKEYCETSFKEAQEQHAKSAPRYDSKALCEEQFGPAACQPTKSSDGSGDFWGPFLAGYVVSNIVDDIGDAASGSRRRQAYSTPVYHSPQGGFYTSQGSQLNSGKNGFSISKKAMVSAPPPAKVQTRTTVVSRGGFGGKSAGWGG